MEYKIVGPVVSSDKMDLLEMVNLAAEDGWRVHTISPDIANRSPSIFGWALMEKEDQVQGLTALAENLDGGGSYPP